MDYNGSTPWNGRLWKARRLPKTQTAPFFVQDASVKEVLKHDDCGSKTVVPILVKVELEWKRKMELHIETCR